MRSPQEAMLERELKAMQVGEQALLADACVARLPQNRYAVMLGGVVHEVGGLHMSLVTIQARVMNLLVGRTDVEPCSHCGNRPRQTGSSWCSECLKVGNRETMRRIRKARKEA